MSPEEEYRKTLASAWEKLITVTEELGVAHDDVKAVGRALLEGGAQEAGSHLYELAERIGELDLFASALRDLVEKAQDRHISSFSRESLKQQLKNK